MTRPRIVVRWFGDGIWPRLARVLTATAQQHCPGWDLDLVRLDPSAQSSPLGLSGCVANTQKLEAWAAAVNEASPGDRLLLLDADTAILRPLDDVWDLSFDVAYTTKPKEARYPFNAGVLFLRVSAAVQAFITAWRDENDRMFHDPKHHQVWRPCYGGLNQSALGALLHQQQAAHLRIQRLPCLEWNCEDEHWEVFEPNRTRIVHYKGALQRALFGRGPTGPGMKPLIALWNGLAAGEHAQKPVPVPPDDRPKTDTPSRIITPGDLSDQMVREGDLETPDIPPLTDREKDPLVPPPVPPRRRPSRRRKRSTTATTEMGDAP